MIRIMLAGLFLVANAVEANDLPSAVVRFEIPGEYNGRVGTRIGSGVHVGNGFILTAEHVAAKDKTVPFLLSNDKHIHTATVLWTSYDYDIALLHAPMEFVPSAEIVCRTPAVGEQVMSIGNLHGLRWFHSPGTVATAPAELQRWRHVYAVTGPIAGGMSGGPVLDRDGRIVGIIVAGPESEAFGFAVPSLTICKLLGRVS